MPCFAGENGLPRDCDAGQMDELEDLLIEGLERPGQALLVASVTGNGVKEWLWYARDVEATQALLNKALTGAPPFPIDLNVMLDKPWRHYLNLKSAADADNSNGSANDNNPRTIN